MKIGIENKISGTVTATATPSTGFEAENVLNSDTKQIYEVNESTTLTITLADVITADALFLFNVNFTGAFTIRLFNGSEKVFDQSFQLTQLDGLESLNIYQPLIIPLTQTDGRFLSDGKPLTSFTTDGLVLTNDLRVSTSRFFNKIQIINNGVFTSIGYVWAGDLINFDCFEEIQLKDSSNDGVTISRTNKPDTQRSYLFREYQLTTKKDVPLNTIRRNVRNILSTGYGNPRPILFDEDCFDPSEVVYGIFDSGSVQYDRFFINDSDGTFKSQITIGIREVS